MFAGVRLSLAHPRARPSGVLEAWHCFTRVLGNAGGGRRVEPLIVVERRA
jgi:hypothetical protein